MRDVTFTVLGRVGLAVDGTDLAIRGRRERAVLALLLAARRRVVSVDALVEGVWGASARDGAPGSLQVAVSRLRAVIEPDRAPRAVPRTLVSSGAGYALLAPADSVDAERFATCVRAAHEAVVTGDHGQAVLRCEQAGALWGGTPFADVTDAEPLQAERARLQDLRLSLLELRAEALLALGRHALLTGELEALVAEHPFRERLWEHYALALYRGGRQGDALAALRRARTVLADELGVDPSPALRRLEADVLAQVPALSVAPGGAARGGPVAADPAPTPPQEPPGAAPPVPQAPLDEDARGPVLVGRDAALRRLVEALDRVTGSGRGTAAIVSGEAGIGKTRLAGELAATATARGARVLWARSHEADVTPAYWPWVPVVRELAGAHPPRQVADLLAPDGSARATSDADSAALRTFDAVTQLLAVASRTAPLLVVLEDVHWADTASLQLLAFAAEALREAPVLLLATVRDVDAPGSALQSCLAALGRQSAVRVGLDGLGDGPVGELVQQLVGSAVDGHALDELAGVVARRTDGNPFFVIELVRLLSAERRLHATGAREVDVPRGVQDVVRLRLARLPDDVHQLLCVAAVTGRDFDLDVLTTVTGREPDDVLDLLDVAVAARLVEDGALPGRYRFPHALVRETLYGSLTLARRGRWHAATATALEPRLDADPDLVAEVAHHFVLGSALRPELAESAVRHAVAAARHSEARGALDQALVHWEEALTADGLAPAPQARRRYEVLLGLGRARYRRGDVAGSRDALDAAVELGRSLDVDLVAEAATSFRGAGVWHWREFGTSDPAMVAVLQGCVAALPHGPLRARSLASLAMELTYEWRSEEADDIGRAAVAAARAVGDHDLLADVIGLRALALWGRPGGAQERIALAEEVLGLPLSREQELDTRFGAAAAHLQLGEVEAADRQMTRCVELARRLRHTGADVPIAWWLFHRAADRGDLAQARRLGEEALDRHRRSSVVAISDMEPLARLRVRGAGAVTGQDVELARTHANPAFRAVVAHALAQTGRAAEAVGLLGAPVPDGAWDYASAVGDCLRVDVMATAGDLDPLPAALARIRPWGHEFALYGSTECVGSIDYFVGRGLEALGETADARAAYARAAAANGASGMVQWGQRAQDRLAALPSRADDRPAPRPR